MDIHRRILEYIDAGRPFAVVQILQAEGSTPLRRGAKAVAEPGGRIWGSIGGGAAEAEAQREAVEACRAGRARVLDFAMRGVSADDAMPICGGALRILVDPTAPRCRETYAQVAESMARRQPGVLLTSVSDGERVTLEWRPAGAPEGEDRWPPPADLRACLAGQAARWFADADRGVEVLAEPVIPAPRLVVAGGGHVGQALARQAVLVGLEVTVVDDRPEFCDRALYPEEVETRCGDIPRLTAEAADGGDDLVVIVTRGHRFDLDTLTACFHRPLAYLGMIGSRRKVSLVRRHLVETGLATEAELDRLHAPVGLDIGAETAAEIAASIVAELIAVYRRGASS